MRSAVDDAVVTRGAFAVAIAVSVLVVLETSKITTGLPSIARDMHVSGAVTQALTAGFLLATAVILVPAGRLGDRFGRRAILLTALGIFLAGSLAAGLAPEGGVLVAGRLLQGIGTGLALPQTIGLIGVLPDAERAKAHATYGVALALANVLGPVVGGLLIAAAPMEGGWRALFLANVPVILVLGALVLWLLPRGDTPSHRGFDVLGSLLLGAGLVALVLPLVWTSGAETDRPERWALFGVCALLLLLFVHRERRLVRRERVPVLDPAILVPPDFRWGLVIGFGWYASVPATLLLISLYAQGALGLAPLESAMLVTPFAAGAGIGSLLARRFVHRSTATLATLGILLNTCGIGAVALVVVVPDGLTATVLVAGATFLAGIGGGMFSTGNQVRTLSAVPAGQEGSSGSVQQLVQRIANALGLALTVIVFSVIGGSSAGLTAPEFAVGLIVPFCWLVIASGGALIDLVREGRARGASPIKKESPLE